MKHGEITITLKDYLFNAGVCGFIKILQRNHYRLDDQDIGNSIQVPVTFLENFEDKYIKTLISYLQNDTLYQSLIHEYEKFSGLNPADISSEDYNKFVAKLFAKLTSASYKSAYEIIAAGGDDTDILAVAKEFKNENDIQKSLSLCTKLIEYMRKHKEILCMKDIIYTRINLFWQGVAFLNTSNAKKDIKECYRKDFVEPVKDYLERKNKGNMQCIQCGNPINASIGKGMSWLNDVGIDMARKRSHYWNFKPDTYICPICALVYSCIPLGFTIVGSEAIFINNNESIRNLVSVNSMLKEGGEAYNTLNEYYYKVLYSFVDDGNQEQTREIQNIQIVKRKSAGNDSGRYIFNTLSKPLLEVLKHSRANFRHLLNWSFKQDKDTYINVYQEVADNFFSGRNQYSLVGNILHKVFDENITAPYVKDILLIQMNQMTRYILGKEGGSYKMFVRRDELEAAYSAGLKIRSEYAKGINADQDKQKKRNQIINEGLRSFVYPLLLSLKTKDIGKFNDTMFRFYVGKSESIPKILIDMQLNDDKFQLLGYAFIAGIQGESMDSVENAESLNE